MRVELSDILAKLKQIIEFEDRKCKIEIKVAKKGIIVLQRSKWKDISELKRRK